MKINKEESKKKYGQNLRRLREARGMSQEELAKALGYTNRSSINKIEIGRSSIPTEKIQLTAQILGVSPLELFEGEEDVNTLPDGSFHGGVDTDKIRTAIFNGDIRKLNEPNQARLMSYYQALLDTQENEE